MKTVGERIKYFRKKRKMTQEQLAELTGIHPVSIRKYETNKMQPQIEQIERIASTLQVNANAIIGYNGAPTRVDTVGDLMGLLMTLYRARVLMIAGKSDNNLTIKPETARLTINPALADFFKVISPDVLSLNSIVLTLKDTALLDYFLKWAICYLAYEQNKEVLLAQPEKYGYMAEELENVELDLLADSTLLDKFKSHSPYLLGYIPDSDEDENNRLFYEIPQD